MIVRITVKIFFSFIAPLYTSVIVYCQHVHVVISLSVKYYLYILKRKQPYFNYLQRGKNVLNFVFLFALLHTIGIDLYIWFWGKRQQINKNHKTIVNSGLNFYLYLIWLEILVSKYVFLVTVKGIQNAIEIFTKAFLCRLWCLKIPASTGTCHMILTSQKSKMVDHVMLLFPLV